MVDEWMMRRLGPLTHDGVESRVRCALHGIDGGTHTEGREEGGHMSSRRTSIRRKKKIELDKKREREVMGKVRGKTDEGG